MTVSNYTSGLCDQLEAELNKLQPLLKRAGLDDGGAVERMKEVADAVREHAWDDRRLELDPKARRQVEQVEARFDVGHCADFAVALAFMLTGRPEYEESPIRLVALLAERTETEAAPDGEEPYVESVKVCLHVFVKATQLETGKTYYLDVAGKHDPDKALAAREQRWRACVELHDHETVLADPAPFFFDSQDDLWEVLKDYGCEPDQTHRELAYLFIKAHSERYL